MPCFRVLASTLAVAVASAGREGPWQQYYWSGKNGDALRTGASTHVVSDLSADPTWSYPDAVSAAAWPHMLVRSHPLIDDKLNIYFAIVSLVPPDGPGAIIKFDPDGNQIWNYTADSPIPNGPALYEGSLFFMTAKGDVGALDMDTSTLRWKVFAPPEGGDGPSDTHSMTAAEGYVIAPVRTNNKMKIPLVEVCPESIFTHEASMCSHEVSPPGGGPENQLVALDPSDGTVLWRFDSDTCIYNSLSAIVDGSVVVADTTGRTYCLDLKTGEVIWKQESADYATANFTGMSTGGAIVGLNRVVYVTSNVGIDSQGVDTFGRISAYALETGDLLWRHDLELPANNAAAVGPISPDGSGPLAVVSVIGQNPGIPPQRPGSKDSKVVAFDAETGERLAWHWNIHWDKEAAAGDTFNRTAKLPIELDETGFPVMVPTGDPNHMCLPDDASNPAIGGDGTVYFGFEDGRVYALRDADGDGTLTEDEVKYFDGGNAYQGSPGIAPGMLVACPCNGMHVFRSPAPAFAGSASPAEVVYS